MQKTASGDNSGDGTAYIKPGGQYAQRSRPAILVMTQNEAKIRYLQKNNI
jgi:hypothetical protein